MTLDAKLHLLVAGLGGGHVKNAAAQLPGQPFGRRRFATTGATGDKDHAVLAELVAKARQGGVQEVGEKRNIEATMPALFLERHPSTKAVAGFLTSGSNAPASSFPTRRPVAMEAELAGYSGGTASDLHRLPWA